MNHDNFIYKFASNLNLGEFMTNFNQLKVRLVKQRKTDKWLAGNEVSFHILI